jgi:hypothetical protein
MHRIHTLIAALVMSLALCTVAMAQTQGQGKSPRPKPTPPPRSQSKATRIHLRVNVNIGRESFTASKSFGATLGTSSGTTYGGGAGVMIGEHLFADVDVTRFTHSGERVFIGPNNQRFGLGIPLHVTTTPIDATVGWRAPLGSSVRPRRSIREYELAPYIGGGVGVLKYTETSAFAESGDNVDHAFTSYHVLAGVDAPVWHGLGVDLGVLYRWVPNAIGKAGVSQVFNEKDLGGATIRVKVTYIF